jgi:hypothetical protein
MYTYVPDQWIRNWFLGGPPTVDYEASTQLARGGHIAFTSALAQVWRTTADRCNPGATLAVRFGALPSANVDPEDLLRSSLTQADSGWAVQQVRTAGRPTRQARQAAQFTEAASYASEIDCIAILR